jgi:hypothetical protein
MQCDKVSCGRSVFERSNVHTEIEVYTLTFAPSLAELHVDPREQYLLLEIKTSLWSIEQKYNTSDSDNSSRPAFRTP